MQLILQWYCRYSSSIAAGEPPRDAMSTGAKCSGNPIKWPKIQQWPEEIAAIARYSASIAVERSHREIIYPAI